MSHIRRANQTDSEIINQLSAGLGYDHVSRDIADKRLRKILKSDVDYLWVYEDDNQIRGWIHLFTALRVASSSFSEIGGLVVSENYRRKGIGQSLVHHAIKWAKLNNLKIRVRCNANREETHIFYKSIGMTQLKSQLIFETGK